MLDFFRHYPNLVIVLMIIAGIGGAMFLLGYLMSIIVAFSDGIKWGIGVVLVPLFAYYYVYRFWDKAAYPGKLLIAGALILFPILITFLFFLTLETA